MQAHRKPLSGEKPAGLQRTDTPGVYQRGDRFVIAWREGGRQHKATFATLEEAVAAKQGHARGERIPVPRVSFDRYATDWIDTYRGRTSRGITWSTRADYRRSLDLYAIPYFAAIRMTDVTPRDIRGYVDHLEFSGQAPSSVRKNFAPVRAMLATAVEDGVRPPTRQA